MKREMNLVRRIALATTEMAPDTVLSALDGVDEHVFVMHVQWMVEAGLLHAALAGGGSAPQNQNPRVHHDPDPSHHQQ